MLTAVRGHISQPDGQVVDRGLGRKILAIRNNHKNPLERNKMRD